MKISCKYKSKISALNKILQLLFHEPMFHDEVRNFFHQKNIATWNFLMGKKLDSLFWC